MERNAGVVVVLAVVAALAPAATASAKLPTFASKKIVPGKSIGGVKPGMTLAAAQAAWGGGGISEAGDACQAEGRTSCIWKGGSVRERALIQLDGVGKVAHVSIAGGPSSPLAKLRTGKGLGLGTKGTVLFTKYHAPGFPVGLGAPLGSGAAYILQRTTYFVGRSSGRVIAVQV